MTKSHGFSITEVLISVLVVAIVAAIVLPMKIIDINQAERIAKWKASYVEIMYSFKLMKKNELKLITAYKNNLFLKPEDYWKHYIKYCNIDKEITERTDFSQYRHVFLNGKIIKHISKYKADNFVILKDGTILGFTGLKRNFAETPLGILFVDVDGFSMRNFIGKDVFILLIYPDRIEPMGNNSSIQEMKEDCSAIGSGLKCSAYYLVGSSF